MGKKHILILEAFFICIVIGTFTTLLFFPEITSNVTAEPGAVSQVSLSSGYSNHYWHGVFGNLGGEKKNNSLTIKGENRLILHNLSLPDCKNAKLFITPLKKIDWEKIQEGKPSDIDSFLKIKSNNPFSGTSQFSYLLKRVIIGNDIFYVPSIKPESKGSSSMGLLKQNKTPIFISKIKSHEAVDGEFRDYEIILPVPKNQNVTYNFFIHPYELAKCNTKFDYDDLFPGDSKIKLPQEERPILINETEEGQCVCTSDSRGLGLPYYLLILFLIALIAYDLWFVSNERIWYTEKMMPPPSPSLLRKKEEASENNNANSLENQ
ncbi:MAG: hypothetical protein ACQESF_07115 [Nanobdellota archaeon]